MPSRAGIRAAAVAPLALGLIAALLAFTSSGGLAKDTGLIFVSSEDTNSVLVIEPVSKHIVKQLKVSRRPRDMHFNADHSRLYIACRDADVIDVIDVAKLEVVGRLATERSPETFGIDESRRRVYVANKRQSSLSVIDIDQGIVTHEVPTGAEPDGIFVGEEGRFVYVTTEIEDFVHLVDAVDGYVAENLVVGTRPRRIAATPDGSELWITAELSGEVWIINREDFTVAGKIAFLPPGVPKAAISAVDLLITRDGKTAYVSLGSAKTIAEVDVRTLEIRGYIVAKHSGRLAISSDQTTLYVVNDFNDEISVIELKSRTFTAVIPVGRGPWAILIDD